MAKRPRSQLAAALTLLALLLVVIAAERGRWFPRLLAAASSPVHWIWSTTPASVVVSDAFVLARDFDLAAVPGDAVAIVGVDPEYVLRLNGEVVGAGSWGSAGGLDAYPVGSLLRVGRNRILIEVRAPLGSGAAAFRLVGPNELELLASSDDWKLYRRNWPRLSDLTVALPPAQPVAELGTSPLGRWAFPAERPRTRQDHLVASAGAAATPAYKMRASSTGWSWRDPDPYRRVNARSVTQFDFGARVTGFVRLEVRRDTDQEGLLYFSQHSSPSLDRDPDRLVLVVPGSKTWQDVAPRRFRYLTVVGVRGLTGASVLPLSERAAAHYRNPGRSAGLFGWAVEPPSSPALDRILRLIPDEEAEAPGERPRRRRRQESRSSTKSSAAASVGRASPSGN